MELEEARKNQIRFLSAELEAGLAFVRSAIRTEDWLVRAKCLGHAETALETVTQLLKTLWLFPDEREDFSYRIVELTRRVAYVKADAAAEQAARQVSSHPPDPPAPTKSQE